MLMLGSDVCSSFLYCVTFSARYIHTPPKLIDCTYPGMPYDDELSYHTRFSSSSSLYFKKVIIRHCVSEEVSQEDPL